MGEILDPVQVRPQHLQGKAVMEAVAGVLAAAAGVAAEMVTSEVTVAWVAQV